MSTATTNIIALSFNSFSSPCEKLEETSIEADIECLIIATLPDVFLGTTFFQSSINSVNVSSVSLPTLSPNKKMTFMLVCDKPDGDLRIQAFVNRAFEWYREAVKSTEDNSRYLYNLMSNPKKPTRDMATQPMPHMMMAPGGNGIGKMSRYGGLELVCLVVVCRLALDQMSRTHVGSTFLRIRTRERTT